MKRADLYKFGVLVQVSLGLCACDGEQAGTADPSAAVVGLPGRGMPDWSGIWIAEGEMADISGFPAAGAQFKLLGTTAPWNETGQARFVALQQGMGAATFKGTGWGYPMMMGGPAPLQFVITPDETVIINMYRDIRHVLTDGREHLPEIDRWVTTWGESIGYWEGDTLVIDTISVRRPNQFFFISPPLSDQAHYVERLRMTAPGRIESEITIEDRVTLSEPWVVNIAYQKTPGLDRLMHDDFTNDRSEVSEDNVFSIEPTAQ